MGQILMVQDVIDRHRDLWTRRLDALEDECGTWVEASRLALVRPSLEDHSLEADPDEMKNLAGTKDVAEVERRLKGTLQEWMILQRDFVPLPVPPPAKKKN